jgi:hypothetical protein
MKNYFLGLTAITFAIALSAFIKPYVQVTFGLMTEPNYTGIVNDPIQWSTDALAPEYALCDESPQDVACTITLNNQTMSTFYHLSYNSARILNDYYYATADDAHLDYVVITETVGASPYRIIYSIAFKHWDPSANSGLGEYLDVTEYLNEGVTEDYNWINARINS